ncbi:MAG: dimethyl sulfoxide reductase anchor subunit [Proteobacteria bacterium]|nr:dimethyl sulfoxide reductase anchor subunit [Pseudomonadota bacterium]
MRPHFSVILLTTLIGAGQGLFLALYVTELAEPLGWHVPARSSFYFVGGIIAGGLALLGLIASFFHLGHPERAWRAATMWRTSWLSREVIVLPAFIAGAFAYGLAHHFGWPPLPLIGVLTLLACLALFVCTAMIYMSLKFLQEWATPLTLVNFFLLGAASGLTLAVPLAWLYAQQLAMLCAYAAIAMTLAAFASRAASLARNARLRPSSSIHSATGIQGRVVQRSQGFTAGSFNTREFFHGATVRMFRLVKWGFVLLVFPLPVLLIAAGTSQGQVWLMGTAFAAQFIGLLAERWFFFAEANHPQNLYYRAIA